MPNFWGNSKKVRTAPHRIFGGFMARLSANSRFRIKIQQQISRKKQNGCRNRPATAIFGMR